MKKNKRKKAIIKYIIVLFIIGCLLVLIKNNTKPYYQIEDRTKNIKEEKKIDLDTIQTIGWVRVQGTNIDHPIINYKENFDNYEGEVGKESFAYNLNTDEKLYNKVNIMGHNILNLSKNPKLSRKNYKRFEELMSFIYIDFAKKNKYIEYTIDGNNYLYKIYAVRVYDSYDDVETEIEKKYTNNEIKKYADKVKKDSLYEYNVKVEGYDNLISLITCTRFYGTFTESAFVVDARMVREGESIKNYSVKETDNYKKILKIMKGDGNDEV